jgi:protein-S-isoprenylcysteine O-methyltransferase Ste14
MELTAYRLALAFVAMTALGRFTGIALLKFGRQRHYARRAVAYPRGWRDRCTVPEPFLQGGVTLLLWLTHTAPSALSATAGLRAGLAAMLAGLAAVLMLWVLRTLPSVSTGHYILPDQQLVTVGPFALVRHPLYLAAILIWLALSLAFASPVALVLTLLYVVPGYWTYARSEEEMLSAHFGEAHARYRSQVGMLLPRPPRAAIAEPGSPTSRGA